MLEDFLKFINTNQLCFASDKILLAVSGGKDSIALLSLFSEAKFNISVAHCNFCLRGQASDDDEVFVRKICEERNIPFFTKRLETKKVANELKISTQMAARELRYDWFKELLAEEKFDLLATAHNLNDKIESLILNISKGTGPKGLNSIPLKKNNIIRPLMFAKLEDIYCYLDQKKLVWREDSSNITTDYQRNKIRHEVIPHLKEINPNLEATAINNFSRFDALNAIFEEKLEQFKSTLKFGEIIEIYPKPWLQSPGFSLILEEFLKPYGFNFQEVGVLLQISNPGKTIKSPTHEISVGREVWYLSEIKKAEDIEIVDFPDFGEYTFFGKNWKFEMLENLPKSEDFLQKNTAYFDFEEISFPFTLRFWQKNDKFQPFGMKGSKLVSDLLIDVKIDLPLKKVQLVLCTENTIIWVVGLRSSEKFRIENHTKKVLKVSFL